MRGAQTYRFVVRGPGADGLAGLVEPIEVGSDGDRRLVTATITDQAQLLGVLDGIADLGLQLVSLERIGSTTDRESSPPDAR